MAAPEIALRVPSKYSTHATAAASSSSNSSTFQAPPLPWLLRTWSVTHSTLSMWRSARNVRISYAALPPSSAGGAARIDDLVEYEALSGKGGVKSVTGVDTASASSAPTTGEVQTETQTEARLADWDWRGKGMLFFVTSHWEILGWGEVKGEDGSVKERWAVTWFAPTLFTKEGLDIYCDNPEGLSEGTAGKIVEALKGLPVEAKKVAEMVERDMSEVAIALPWKER